MRRPPRQEFIFCLWVHVNVLALKAALRAVHILSMGSLPWVCEQEALQEPCVFYVWVHLHGLCKQCLARVVHILFVDDSLSWVLAKRPRKSRVSSMRGFASIGWPKASQKLFIFYVWVHVHVSALRRPRFSLPWFRAKAALQDIALGIVDAVVMIIASLALTVRMGRFYLVGSVQAASQEPRSAFTSVGFRQGSLARVACQFCL